MIAYVKVVDGRIEHDDRIQMMANGKEAEVLEVGFFSPMLQPVTSLTTGEVGYIATGLKTVRDCEVGDTVTLGGEPGHRAAAGLSAGQADGLRRPLPDGQ